MHFTCTRIRIRQLVLPLLHKEHKGAFGSFHDNLFEKTKRKANKNERKQQQQHIKIIESELIFFQNDCDYFLKHKKNREQ